MATPHITNLPKLAQRFWNRVNTGPDDACWEWQGCRHRRVLHGQINIGGHPPLRVYTHRLAFFFVHGWWPPLVIHACDNPPCCNPKHLRAAKDNAENQADKVAKGRQLRGETSKLAKVTEAQVRDIRARWIFRKVTLRQLGLEHGLSIPEVHAIVQRRAWKHI